MKTPSTSPKYKIKHKKNRYDINQSPLFKLNSKKRLAEILRCDLSRLKSLRNDANYSVYPIEECGKTRIISKPLADLDRVQTKIATYLCRINPPNYLHSGIKGKSNISNAKVHCGQHPVLKTDLVSFFTSTSKDMVFSFFYRKMKCQPDIAELLSKICTYKEHIPTGSSLSMILAYYANHRMFDELGKVSNEKGITFSVFVDDLTFSGEKVNTHFKRQVKKIVRKHNHKLHHKKTRIYGANDAKLITGCIIKGNDLRSRNKDHKKAYDLMADYEDEENSWEKKHIKNSLLGILSYISAIEPKYSNRINKINRV